MPPVDLEPTYGTTTCASDDPLALMKELHTKMRRAEGATASALATGCFVVADGPLNEFTAPPRSATSRVIAARTSPDTNAAWSAQLPAGQRTPLFTIGEARYRRYSWYLRLADRCQGATRGPGSCAARPRRQLPQDCGRTIADRTAAVLPIVASEAHLDPRAPQNLVPIAALERDLRHRMGDPAPGLRALRTAVMGGVVTTTAGPRRPGHREPSTPPPASSAWC